MPYLDGLPIATSVSGTDVIAVDQGGTVGLAGTATTRQTTVAALLQLGPGPITGPGSSVDGDIVTFNGTTGRVLKDSGFQVARVVQGPVSSTSGDLPAFSGTSGNVVIDSGVRASAVIPQIASIAVLRAATTTTAPNSIVYVIGYRTGADGGEGMFWYNSSDTSTADNSGTVIVDASARRWYRETGGLPLSILWFGGFNNGATANDTAFARLASVAENMPSGAQILFPPGKYMFSAQQSINFPSNQPVFDVDIFGAGAILYWPNVNGGLLINLGSPGHTFSLEGMHFTTGQAAGGTGLFVGQGSPLSAFFQSKISDVVFRGDDNHGNIASFYWTNCAEVLNVCGTCWDTVTCYGSGSSNGNGLVFTGTGTNPSIDYSIQHGISQGIFNNLGIGILYSDFAQGIAITQSLFQNSKVGISTIVDELGVLAQMQVSDCSFGCLNAGIDLLTSIGNVFIHDNDMFCFAGTPCIQIFSCQGCTIANNALSMVGPGGATSYGVYLKGTITGTPSTITGNTIVNMTYGVFLDTTAQNVLVASNATLNCTTPFQNNGTGNVIGVNLP